MPERRRKYESEFKDEAARMVVETSRPIAEVAREIYVNEPSPASTGPCGYQRSRARLSPVS
jgi:transposase